MEDHVWLVDTEGIFKGQKYIMKVAPSTSGPDFEDKVEERVNEVGDFMSKPVLVKAGALKARALLFASGDDFGLFSCLAASQRRACTGVTSSSSL